MIKEKSQTWAYLSAQLGRAFAKLPMPPNFYTWSTIPVALVGLFFIIYNHIVLGIIFFIFAGLLDLVDGAVARHLKRASHYGAFLDGSLDRFIDFLLIFSYFWLSLQTPGLSVDKWLFCAIFFALMPSFEVAYANHRKAVIDPEEKIIWRILNRGEMYVLMLLIPLLAIFSSTWSGYLLVLLVVLSAVTTLQTLFHTLWLAKKTN
jgi:archaetidylinositol phosphate synthase